MNVFTNIPSTFLLFKASAFLQIFFPRNLLFQQVLRTSVFLNSKCLKTANKRTHIPLFINQIISLIEQKMQPLMNYWNNACKFIIDKITYSKCGSLEHRMTLVKINSCEGFIESLRMKIFFWWFLSYKLL